MKYPNFFILWAIVFLTSSCTKDIIPGEEDYKNHSILWTNELQSDPNSKFYPPVLDEENNVYLLVKCSDESSGEGEKDKDSSFVKIISYDRKGNKRWERKVFGEVSSELYYSSGRIYFLSKSSYYAEKQSDKLYFLDAESSEIISVHDTYAYAIGVSETHVYLLHSSAVKTISRITAFDFEGNEIWEKQGVEGKEMMVRDHEIYISDMLLIKYIDQGDGCAYAWEWAPPEENSIDLRGIDNIGNLYLSNYLKTYVLDSDGQLLKQFSGMKFGGYNRFVKITGEGEYFIGDETGLYKYDQKLHQSWHIENSESSVRPYFQENNIAIAQNGNIYNGSTFGIYAYRSDGVLDWHIGLYQDILDLHRPIITSEGNLICLSPERGRVYCIKGDGSSPE